MQTDTAQATNDRFANPYLAGVGLGLVLLTGFLVMGKGLGASGAAYRVGVQTVTAVAPDHAAQNDRMGALAGGDDSPLDSYFVFLALGVILGGIVSSYAAGRAKLGVIRGPRIGLPARLALALTGGAIMGFAARITRGCTSGQALSGGALLSVGAWVFMMSVFAGGFALAYFVRRQWR